MNVILMGATVENPIDDEHWFVTIGPNCWGTGVSHVESLRNCKANAPRGARRFLTRVAPRDGLGIDPVDGSISWSEKHDARTCKLCTVGKGIHVAIV